MADLGELTGDGGADPLRRRDGAGQGGEGGLDGQGALLQLIVVCVGNFGRGVGVVEGVVAGQFGGQALQLLAGLVFGQGFDGSLGHGNRAVSLHQSRCLAPAAAGSQRP
ncbi:hypothetical protein D3C72_1799340 [compost metagenome]